jgi:hypothetical protein
MPTYDTLSLLGILGGDPEKIKSAIVADQLKQAAINGKGPGSNAEQQSLYSVPKSITLTPDLAERFFNAINQQTGSNLGAGLQGAKLLDYMNTMIQARQKDPSLLTFTGQPRK